MKFEEIFNSVISWHKKGPDGYERIEIEVTSTVVVDPNHQYGGWFETYDVATDGDTLSIGGVLEIHFSKDGAVTVMETDALGLPEWIIDSLEKKGVEIDSDLIEDD